MVKDLRPKKPSAVNGGLPALNGRAEANGMSGRIQGELLLSVLAHGGLLAILLFVAPHFTSNWHVLNPTQTVQLVDLPGGGGPGGPEPPKVEKPPEPKVEKPAPPPPAPKAEAPKPEMTLPTPKAKEPAKREEKKAEPPERQLAEKKKEVAPIRPPAEPARKPEPPGKREVERPAARGTGPAGAGSGPGGGLALGTGGGAVSLDTANFPFTYYLRQITDRIEQNWLRPQENVGRVVVYFRIKRDGSIVEPQVQESSRNPAVDLLASGAVKRSEPFPPLPIEFGGDYLGVYLCFGIGDLCPGRRQG